MGPWAFRLLAGLPVPQDPGGGGFRAVVERLPGFRLCFWWPALFGADLALPAFGRRLDVLLAFWRPGLASRAAWTCFFGSTMTIALCQLAPHSFWPYPLTEQIPAGSQSIMKIFPWTAVFPRAGLFSAKKEAYIGRKSGELVGSLILSSR